MMGGPAPIPTALKLLGGNKIKKGKTATLTEEPVPEIGATCPSFLDAEAKKEWRRIAPELERLGLLTKVDRAMLAAYCATYSRWIAAEKKIHEAKGEMTMVANNGSIQIIPEINIAKECMRSLLDFANAFGFTPASRTRIRVPNKATQKKSLEDFIGKKVANA